MGLFRPKYKNEHKLFVDLENFNNVFNVLLEEDAFISKKTYDSLVKKTKQSYDNLLTLKNESMLKVWCQNNKCDLDALNRYLETYQNHKASVKKHNDTFVTNHLKEDEEYLDHILDKSDSGIKLDKEQRTAVLRDEDYTLLIAGAGAGKTTTLAAKAKYLVDKLKVDPQRILVVSFTRKATKELQERFDAIGVNAKISTFHSMGYEIIKGEEETKKNIVESGYRYEVLSSYFKKEAAKDESFVKKTLLFFASYLENPFGGEIDPSLYRHLLHTNGVQTMKEDVKQSLEQYKNELTKRMTTVRGERVRSYQECAIANFLYINGIDYEYEPLYPYFIRNSSKPYTPDFLIKQDGKTAYLEHFGITEDGRSNRFTPEELIKYKKSIEDKIILHKKHSTTLLSTFSSYLDGKDLVVHLKEELEKNGFELRERNRNEIYQSLAKIAEDRYFYRLITLISNFINRFKTNNFKSDHFSTFKNKARINGDERSLLFLDIAEQCYLYYENRLKEDNALDFEDMINNASDILDEAEKRGEKLPFDYIFVDEYQDISMQRFNLAEKLSKVSDAKILAVGDDWQSIYRFAGSQLSLFTEFEKKMGYADILYLNNTHRNSQELIDVAGSFVMENDKQFKKNLKSAKHLENPIQVITYDDSPRDYKNPEDIGPLKRMGNAIDQAVGMLIKEYGKDKSIALLGRYNFDGGKLGKLEELFYWDQDKKKAIARKHENKSLSFLTAHSSKGLGFDNVILVNGKDDVLGFPSKIEDDPVMKFVLPDNHEIDYAEERRLFYVALTRTKNRVLLITPKTKPSEFILEITKGSKNVPVINEPLKPILDARFKHSCPKCGYPLQYKKSKISRMRGGLSVYVCSNDPEVCGFVTNDLNGGDLSIKKCHKCMDGYLIVKPAKDKNGKDTGRRILGCTNYKRDGSGCDCVLQREENNLENITRNEKNYNGTPIENCYLCEYPVKDLLKIIDYAYAIVGKRNISLSITQTAKVITGSKDQFIQKLELDKEKVYNCISESRLNELISIEKDLLDRHFLEEVGDEYHSAKRTEMPITEELARGLFEDYLFTNKR